MSSPRCGESTPGRGGARRRPARPAPAVAAPPAVAALVVAALAATALGPARAFAADELDFGLEQHLLHRIDLRGNRALAAGELKSILRIQEPSWLHPFAPARYRPDLLEAELRLLTRYYRQRGFHQVAVALDSISRDPRGRGDVVHISIDEGPRTYLERLEFVGAAPLSPAELGEGLVFREGRPVPADLNDLGQDLYTLRLRYWDAAHLQAAIVPELVTAPTDDPERRSAVLTYRLAPGRAYTLRDVAITGNTQTRTELIRREISLKPGAPLRWSEAAAAQRRLLETALFRDVSVVPAALDTAAGTADVAVHVVERRPAYTEIGIGVGSRERVRGLLAWGHNNLGGTGQRLALSARPYLVYERILPAEGGKSTPQFNWRLDLLHTHPHFLGERLRLESNLYYEKQTRGTSGLNLTSFGLAAGSRFRTGRDLLHLVTAQVEIVDPALHPDAPDSLRLAFAANQIRENQTRSLNYSLLDDRRDNPFRPARGAMLTGQAELAGGFMGGDNSFLKGVTAWHLYQRLGERAGVVAARVSVGAVRPYGDSAGRGVPYQERFFAGGASSVRGYLEASLGPQITAASLDSLISSGTPVESPAAGGNYLLLANIEWRFPLPLLSRWKLGGVLFVDSGNVWERLEDIQLRGFRWRSYARGPQEPGATKLWDYRYSVGTGLRLDTPFGPFRFDVGFPLKRARLSESVTEDKVMVHFSLGYPF